MPDVVVIAGPNGAAGKTTVAPTLLRDLLQVPEFVNADQIATGLSGFNPQDTAFQAGRLMLSRLHELAREGTVRVARRVRLGGHDVPAAIVNRRYRRSLANFFALYQNLADEWRFYDNSRLRDARLVAAGSGNKESEVVNEKLWRTLRRRYAKDG